MSWSIEEYLVYILDYFEDYSGFVIILAYDLRIDAYIDYRLGLVKDYKILEPGLLKITRKAKHEATENSESHIEYELERVVASDLNAIESAYYQKFMSTHPIKVLESREKENNKLQICLGKIEKVSAYQSPIYEKSFELLVNSKHLAEKNITLLTQEEKYDVGDDVCFLIRTDKDHQRVLGLKPRQEVGKYLDQKIIEQKNNELKLIEIK